MNYPVHIRAVRKWAAESLSASEDGKHFIFGYEGSTCKDGGTAFNALFHVRMKDPETIERAWIELPEQQLSAASKMCGNRWENWSGFQGAGLEKAICREQQLNYAGCLCYEPMINQKWKMVLSAVHYYLNS